MTISYDQLIGHEALDAVQDLFESNRDLALSLDIAEATNQIIAYVRLNSKSLEQEESVYGAYQTALGSLLRDNKIQIKPFGFSTAGAAQRDNLLRHIGALPEEIIVDPFEEVIRDWHNLDTFSLSQKLQDADYRATYQRAAAEGKLYD